MVGISDIDGDTAIGCVYGVSGKGTCHQMPLWSALVSLLRMIGLPFVAGGDWQKSPEEVSATGILGVLGAQVCHAHAATNLISGSNIDFFLVSESLARNGLSVSVIHGAAFSPHAPVRLALHGVKGKTECGQRLSSPKPLPVHRPVGPLLPGIAVDWEKLNLDDLLGGNMEEGDISKVCETCSGVAGAECELASSLGVSGTDEEARYLGLGEDPRIVKYRGRGRFRDVSSDLGIIGRRLNWVAKSLHLVLIHSSSIAVGNDLDGARADVLMRIGHRAWALSREKWSASVEVDGECRALIRRFLSFLTSIVRTSHGAPPLVARWALGDAEAGSSPRAALAKEVAASHSKLCDKRRGRALKEARAWARRASAAELHRATKPPDQHGRKSASAEKDHRGERTDYEAAVHGAHEWQPLWMATAVDTSDDIMSALEALGKVHSLFRSIRLPPLRPRPHS